jgi:predicted transcriptional regulator
LSIPRGLFDIAYDILNALHQEKSLNLTAIYRKTLTDRYTQRTLEILHYNGLILEQVQPKAFLKTRMKEKVATSLGKGERPPRTYERVFTITEKGIEALSKLEELKRTFRVPNTLTK